MTPGAVVLSLAPPATSTTALIELAVTPCVVVPPLSEPDGHGSTQGGARKLGSRTRLVDGSQLGAASAAALPVPGPPACGADTWVPPLVELGAVLLPPEWLDELQAAAMSATVATAAGDRTPRHHRF